MDEGQQAASPPYTALLSAFTPPTPPLTSSFPSPSPCDPSPFTGNAATSCLIACDIRGKNIKVAIKTDF
ncbi:Hypothetical protein NTJ_03150 [Nesidiocoris tenuis]|uniref:Carbohydrate kinase FGGY N-terminal domain-containing protein n=1 Tax=Nesidiocoris tenuis TaxID=355587 RepID=A0ABN7ADG8_9HEMI|nr:Hypothetical protein NTJ_03150 [Nesidiocoris tenuis]